MAEQFNVVGRPPMFGGKVEDGVEDVDMIGGEDPMVPPESEHPSDEEGIWDDNNDAGDMYPFDPNHWVVNFDGTLNPVYSGPNIPLQPPPGPPGGSAGGGGRKRPGDPMDVNRPPPRDPGPARPGEKRPGDELDDYYEGRHPPRDPGPPRAGEKRPREDPLLQFPDAIEGALEGAIGPLDPLVDFFDPPDSKRGKGIRGRFNDPMKNPLGLGDPTLPAPTNFPVTPPVPTIPEDPMEEGTDNTAPFWLHVLLGLPVLFRNYLN